MEINVTYDPSVAGAPSGFMTAVQAAVQYWDAEITTPITVNIAFGYGEVEGQSVGADNLGESISVGANFNYAQVLAALTNTATSPDDLASIGAQPTSDPTNGGLFFVTSAESKALGLYHGGPAAIDGYVGLSSSEPFTYAPSQRAVSGDYDAVGTLEHEISEVLGRISSVGDVENGVDIYSPLDLFRYSGAGIHNLAPGAANFSIDGQQMLLPFNNAQQNNGDSGDWGASVSGDSFDAFTPAGIEAKVSPTDLRVMDALGYSISEQDGNGLDSIFNAANISSFVYDTERKLLYFGTTSGTIYRWSPYSQTFLTPINIGGDITSLALSSDDQFLLAGRSDIAADGDNFDVTIDRVSLNTLAITPLVFTVGGYERGVASIAVDNQDAALVSTTFGGSGWTPIRSFPAETSSFNPTPVSGLASVSAPAYLISSEHGRYILVAPSNISDGPLQLYDSQSGTVVASTDLYALGAAGFNNGKEDVNEHAGLVVDDTYNNIFVLNTSLSLVKDLSSLQRAGSIIGAHFSENGRDLFLWDASTQDILVYDTTSWEQTATIPVTAQIAGPVGDGNLIGLMQVSGDGRFLFLDTGVGIETIDLAASLSSNVLVLPPDDFNADGRSDILFAGAGGALATWQLNDTQITGGGGLGSPGPQWRYAGSGDFNGDGMSDLLFAQADGTLATWQMSGTTIIGGGVLGNPGAGWTELGVGDFNGDGKSDILFENTSGTYATWDLNGTSIIGGGTLGAPGPDWVFKAIGDFNGDGKSDILFENADGTYATWQLGDTTITGGGNLGSPGVGWSFVGVGDFNGDGRSDILFENASGTYATWDVSGTQIIGGGTIGDPGAGWSLVGIGDYNGDGKSDLLFRNIDGTLATWDLNDTAITGGGTIGNPGSSNMPEPLDRGQTFPTLFFEQANGTIATWEVNATQIVGGGTLGSSGSTTPQVVGDFTGAGAQDVAFQAANGTVTTWLTDGTHLIGGASLGNPGADWGLIGAGDFNGDGTSDLLFHNTTTGMYATWDISNDAVVGGGSLGNPGSDYAFEGIGDLNGDGKADILFKNTTTGDYWAWLMNDTQIIGGGDIGNPGGSFVFKALGDMNGDGKADILFEDASGNYASWDLNGISIIGGGNIGNPGGTWTFSELTDLNGDHKADILFTDASGALASWTLDDTHITGGGTIGNPGPDWHLFG